MNPDKRALKILFDTYWGPRGWKQMGGASGKAATPPDDYDYARRVGLMFPACKATHDETIQRIGELRGRISPRDVALAFVHSFESATPGIRSALGSYSVSLNMSVHEFSSATNDRRCQICGGYATEDLDLNLLNFERHKWAGVRHEQPHYIAFDLERFAVEKPHELATDYAAWLDALRACVGSVPADGKLLELVRSIKPMMSGNEAQRRAAISILGFSGLLRIPGRPGFLNAFTPVFEREQTPWSKDDWPYPVRWWRGGAGIDEAAVDFWFGTA